VHASPGLFARFATNDAPAITSAIEGIVDLARKPAWQKWEKDFGLTKVDRAANHATFAMEQGSFQATWETKGGEVDFAAGIDAGAVMIAASPHTAALDPKITAFQHDLRANVMWALVARPLLLASSPRSDAAMLGFARERDHAVLHARATGVLVRNLFVSAKGL